MTELSPQLAARRRRRIRGWIEIAVGTLLSALGIAVMVVMLIAGRNSVVVTYGPLVIGIAAIVRGVLRLADMKGLPFAAAKFVAFRYLMVANPKAHRYSKPAQIGFFFGLAVGIIGLAMSYMVSHRILFHIGPEGAPPWLGDLILGLVIGGFAIAGLSLFFGTLRSFFTFFTTVPIGGVWIGTGALVCVLSVMSGFESDLREKILGSNAHIQITREDGEFTDWHNVKAQIDKVPGVVATTPYAVSEVVIAANSNGMNVIIKGIDPQTVGNVTELVNDIEGPVAEHKDAIKRLEPLVDDPHDLRVPQQPPRQGGVDPAPADLPTGGDPIDYSQPADDSDLGSAGSDDSAGGDSPGSGSGVGSGSGDFGGDAQAIVGSGAAVDPAPDDLVTSDEPPIDYSDPGSGYVDPSIHVVDVPIENQSLSRRTQALPGILVGKELDKQMHLYLGEEVRVVSPLSDPSNPDATGTPIPFNRDYRVAGKFFTGMYEYDLKYVYVTLDSLDEFLDRGDAVDGIEVRVGSPDDTDAYVARIEKLLGPQYRVQDWKELNRSLFSALKLEKIAMFLVLGIVILVASFSIVGNLIMVVVEKAREIALLKTLGASDVGVMEVFAIQGLLIGLIGTVLGVATGLLACWAGKRFGIPLNPDVYYIDRMPVHVEINSVIVTALAGVLISIAATFYPAMVAARVRPSAGMRH